MIDPRKIRQQNILDQFMSGQGLSPDAAMGQPASIPDPRMSAPVNPIQQQQTPGSPTIDWVKRMDELYKPSTVATDRFNTMIDEFPTRRPASVGRKIVASMTGLSKGVKEADDVLQAPNNRRIGDWKVKSEPAYQAANLERYGNVNERQLAGQIVTAEAADRRLTETERSNKAKELEAERRRESNERIQRDRRALEQAKMEGAEFFTRGPEIMAMYKNGPLKGKAIPTGVMTGDLSELELQNILAKREINLENTRSRNDRLEITLKGEQDRIPNPNRRGSSAASDSPADERRRRNNLFTTLWNTRTDLRPYMVPPSSPNDDWMVGNPPSGWGPFDVDPEKKALFEELQRLTQPITPAQPNAPAQSTTKPTTAPANKPPVPAGRVVVEKDGKQFTVPSNQLQDAIKQGYRQVK